MKKFFPLLAAMLLLACNNSSKKETSATDNTSVKPNEQTDATAEPTSTTTSANSSKTKFTIDGNEITVGGSILVQKDKDKLKPGNDFLVMLTAPGGPNKETLSLNFLMDLKPGVYPVVGTGFQRGPEGNGELYGGIMGGKPALTNYNVNISECKDLGSNGIGGHKWSISGTFDEITIPAMKVMLMDKTKNHPAEVKLSNGSFSNLTFDDNWQEMLEKAMDKIKKD